MYIIAIDTCRGRGSVSLTKSGKLLVERNEPDGGKLAERLVGMINSCLEEAGCSFSNIDLLAVTIGPGSFTGIRIGMAAAKGLRIATKIPLIGISTLQATAFAAQKKLKPEESIISVLHDAKRGQVYAQRFTNDKTISSIKEPELLSLDDINDYLAKSYLTVTDSDFLDNINNGNSKLAKISFTNADVAMLAEIHFSENKGEYNKNIAPLYIRPPDAKLPKNHASA